MRQRKIWVNKDLAGILTEDEVGYHFAYSQEYREKEYAHPVSLTLTLQKEAFHADFLFPFLWSDSRRLVIGHCSKEMETKPKKSYVTSLGHL